MIQEKLVIINGDDFGYSPGINEGISLAFKEGILTSTSAMANLLTGEERLDRQDRKVNKPPLGVGVHLNLTFGTPLNPELFEGKDFTRPFRGQDPSREWLNSVWIEYFKKFREEDVEAEYRSQILKAKEILGELDHLDSHHGSDFYVGDAYLNVAKEFNLAARPSSPFSEVSIEGGDFQDDPTFFDRAKQKGVRTVTRLIMKYFHRDADPLQAFFESLATVKPGEVVEYMFHPSVDGLKGDWRMRDLEVLTSPKTAKKVEELGITLTTYGASAILPTI